MKISDLLSSENSVANIRVSEKAALLKELCARAAISLNLEADALLRGLLKREELGSTGVGGGIAIPHARIPGIQRPFGVLARLTKPIEFNAVDERPVDIAFMLLLPGTPVGEELNALASVTRKLRDPSVVARIRKAPDGASMYRAITGA
jgi:PTS system nitrogen regulatory IIA component